jgi:hypothetical protein
MYRTAFVQPPILPLFKGYFTVIFNIVAQLSLWTDHQQLTTRDLAAVGTSTYFFVECWLKKGSKNRLLTVSTPVG